VLLLAFRRSPADMPEVLTAGVAVCDKLSKSGGSKKTSIGIKRQLPGWTYVGFQADKARV